MPQSGHRDAGERIEISLARRIEQATPLTMCEGDILAGVGIHQVRHGNNRGEVKQEAKTAARRLPLSRASVPANV